MIQHIIRRISGFRSDESGANAVEFSIVVTAFIIASLGVIELGRSFQIRNEMAYAADRGARIVTLNPDTITEQQIIGEVEDSFVGYETGELDVTVTAEVVSGTNYRNISVSYPMKLFVPMMSDTVTLTVSRRAVVL